MRIPPLAQPLSDASFTWLRNFLERESGISLRAEKRSLIVSRLQKRLEVRAQPDFDAYCRLLQLPAESAERNLALDALTTHETYFFRDPRQFAHLRTRLKSWQGEKLRVWSAACSTGEEAWSLAMLLHESLGPEAWELQASDLSLSALEHAARSLYRMERLQYMPPGYLHSYCRKGLQQYSGYMLIKRTLRERVRFFQHNLLEDVPALGKFDVIFLRNTLIYFDQPRRQQILSHICAHLKPGAHLYLGESESMLDHPAPLLNAGNSIFRYSPERAGAEGAPA